MANFHSHRAGFILRILAWMVVFASGQPFEPPDLDITKSLLNFGVNVSAIPALGMSFKTFQNSSCDTAVSGFQVLK